MEQNIIKANRERDLWLAEKDEDTGDITNAYYIPKGWCDEFTYAKGFAAGPDWLEHLPDSGLDDAPSLYCYAPWFTQPNSEVGTLFVDVAVLQAFDEISKGEALEAHPAMLDHLKSIDADFDADRLKNPDLWCYPPHHDDDWRLCPEATNSWMGTIETKGGDELVDLTDWAGEDWHKAIAFARMVVQAHNWQRFNVRLEDY